MKSGEKILLDGEILKGESTLDKSMLTGESVPVDKEKEVGVIGGAFNGNGVLTIEVKKKALKLTWPELLS